MSLRNMGIGQGSEVRGKKSFTEKKDFYSTNIKPLLPTLDLELTERCNNNCLHCYNNLSINNKTAKQKELSTIQLKKILKEASTLGCLTVRFTGGEPLLREDFKELYIYARELGLKVLIFTNATLITPEIGNLLKKIPPLEKVEISVYGMSRKSYEAVTRVPGSFAEFKRGIKQLLKNKIPFIVKGALLPQNIHEKEIFEKCAAKIPWMIDPPQYSMFFDLRVRRDSKKKNDQIKKLRISPENAVNFLVRDREKYIKEVVSFCTRFTGIKGDKLFSCGAGKAVCIDPYGEIFPCMLLKDPDLAVYIKKYSISFSIANIFSNLKNVKAKNPEYLSTCGKCFLFGFCEQCPAKSWAEYGTLDSRIEYLCEIAHRKALYAGLLKKNEKAWEVKNGDQRIKALGKKFKILQ